MTFSIPELIGLAAALLVIYILLHKLLPAGTFAKVKAAAKDDIAKLEADVRVEAVAASSKFESWVTDLSAELAMKAKAQALNIAADASIKAKQDLARAHAAKVLATLPPV